MIMTQFPRAGTLLSFLQVVKTPYAKTPPRTKCEITETYLERKTKDNYEKLES